MAAGAQPGLGAGLGQGAHAADVGRALGDADHAARVQQVEQVAGLQALVVGRQRQPALQDRCAMLLGVGEVAEQQLGVGDLEIERRIFALGLQEDVAVGHAMAVEVEIVDVLDALDVHGQPLEAVGQLARDRAAVEAADLLEIGELRHLHAVAPDLPAQAPGAQGRAFPVVLDEAQVVQAGVDAQRVEAAAGTGPGSPAATAS